MTHIAAAALIADDNEVDVNDLRDDLKIDNKAYVYRVFDHPHVLTTTASKHTLLNSAVGSCRRRQLTLSSSN